MSTISSSDAGNRDAPDAATTGRAASKSFGAFVCVNLADVPVGTLGALPISGFSCFMVALVNSGKEELSQSLVACGNKDSKNKTKKTQHVRIQINSEIPQPEFYH